ncbi:MAG: hypothetical protein R3F53_08630 [Gammaproteobacteria bacterium]
MTGQASRCFVVKAEGPYLGANAISDPALIVRDFTTNRILDSNNNWADHPSANLIQTAGLKPQIGKESALAIRLSEGIYVAELYSVFLNEAGKDSIIAVTELPEASLEGASCDTTRTPTPAPKIEGGAIQAFISQPVAAGLGALYTGQLIYYSGNAITQSGNAKFQWDFGSSAQFNSDMALSAPSGFIRYGQEGEKTIRLTVTVNGVSSTTQTTIRVRPSRDVRK